MPNLGTYPDTPAGRAMGIAVEAYHRALAAHDATMASATVAQRRYLEARRALENEGTTT